MHASSEPQSWRGQATSWNMRSTSTSLPGAFARGAGALAAASAAVKRSTSGRCCPRTVLGCAGFKPLSFVVQYSNCASETAQCRV